MDRLLRDGIALRLAESYQPFPAVAAAALRTLARGALDADAVGHFLGRNNVAGYVDTVISAAEVSSWKPSWQIYDHAMRIIARPAGEVALIAVHAFDCHGAKSAGWVTGWASRLEGHDAAVFTPAGLVGPSRRHLIAVATGLLALPA